MEPNRIRNCVAAGCVFLLFFGVNGLFGFEITKFYEGFKPGDHHLEIRDLGFEYADQIAPDESAITSLVETPAGDIYGGTTGRACHLFVFRPFYEPGKLERLSNNVKHLGKLSGQESIHHSLLAGENGEIYIGTGLNELDQPPISDPPQGSNGIVTGLWSDIKKRYDKYEGGHLYKYTIANEKRTWIKNDDECAAKDLGIPVPHNGIYAMTINNQRKEIYGISYPDGHFFVYDINSGKFTDIGAVYEKTIYAGPDNRTLRNISRDLVCDDNGFVYGSADDAVMFRYDPDKKKIEKLSVKTPFLYFTAVEVFTKDSDGVIYGGTAEGYLFRFEPERMKITNLGKPYAQRRIRALTVGKNGLLYGLAGQRDNHCRMFSYNIVDAEFDDLGLLRIIREPYYSWSGIQFDAMLTGKDGIIYAGESERRSHLFLYYP